jgi:UDP-N-acetylmuramoylalanine--D-glutamate ligase
MKNEVKKGGYIKNEQMMLKIQEERVTMSIYDFALKGKHNQYNTMAASIAASTLGIRKEKIREAVSNFHNLEHRMEFVATVKGVDFINDSKATNVNSTWYALESMQKPTVLILGGVDKGNDYELIADLVKDKVKAIVCMGTDNEKLLSFFKGKVANIVEVDSASKAVQSAFSLADKNDVVLLSPACASFDLFKNYEDRGRQFKEAVKEL